MVKIGSGEMVSPWTEGKMSKMTNLGKNLCPLQPVLGGEGSLTLHLQICPFPGAFSGENRQRDPVPWAAMGRAESENQEPGWWDLGAVEAGVSMIPSETTEVQGQEQVSPSGFLGCLNTFQPTCDLLQDVWNQGGQRKGDGGPCRKNTKQ